MKYRLTIYPRRFISAWKTWSLMESWLPAKNLYRKIWLQILGYPGLLCFPHSGLLKRNYFLNWYPEGGAFVRKNTEEDLLHVFDIRLKMEPLAARAAAIRNDSDSLQEIEDRHKTFAEAVMAGDRILYKRAD
jgi:hypothetical protein